MIERVELKNFLSHKDTSLDFSDGTNIFIGMNGAGKSSVIDAITYAIFGEHTRGKNVNIVRRGANGGEASVTLTIKGKKYKLTRRFDANGSLNFASIGVKNGEYKILVSGERRKRGYDDSVTKEAEKLLGLDYNNMKVATIVQQGELDAIINYQPKELKNLVNNIIGMDKLDEAYKRLGNVLSSTTESFRKRLRDEYQGYDDTMIEKLSIEISKNEREKEEASKELIPLKKEISDLKSREEDLERELQRLEELRRKAEQLKESRDELIKYASDRFKEIKNGIKDLDRKIDEAYRCFKQIEEKSSIELKYKSIEDNERSYKEKHLKILNQIAKLEGIENNIKSKKYEIGNEKSRLRSTRERISNLNEELTRLLSFKDPTEKTIEELNSILEAKSDEKSEMHNSLGAIMAKLEDYKRIKSDGICPTCDTPIHSENIDNKISKKEYERINIEERLERCSKEIERIKRLIDDKKRYEERSSKINDLNKDLNYYKEMEGDLLTSIERKESEIESMQDELNSLSLLKEERKKIESLLKNIETEKKTLESKLMGIAKAEVWLEVAKISSRDDIIKLENERERLNDIITSMPEGITADTPLNILARLDDHARNLTERIKSLEEATKEYDQDKYLKISQSLLYIKSEREKKSERSGGLDERVRKANEEIQRLQSIKGALEEASKYYALYEKIRNEVYHRDGRLAMSIRRWALQEISKRATDYMGVFGMGISQLLLKENEQSIEIKCYSPSGQIDTQAISGGEKVAVALALRFAMAGLIGRGMLDFIILDEPTVHLDQERKHSIADLIAKINENRSSILRQIIIITHDQDIFEKSEDMVFRFEKRDEGTKVLF